jgi:hypothetical protein
MRRIPFLAALVAIALAGCRAEIPSGRFVCNVDGDCPPSQRCRAGLCFASDDPPDGSVDLGRPDAGPRDGAMPDANARDLGAPDADLADAAALDLGDADLGAPDLGAPDAGCALLTDTLVVESDTTIVPSDCNGANHLGAFTHTHSGIGRTLYKFFLTAEGRRAFMEGRVRSLALRLTRVDDVSSTGPCGGACPATAGTLTARPLRFDWSEGSDGTTTFMPYEGADWCRRSGRGFGESPWVSPGASNLGGDVLDTAGATTVTADQPDVVIPLDPARWSGILFIDAVISVQVLGSSDGAATFLAWSREGDASRAARLDVRYCP